MPDPAGVPLGDRQKNAVKDAIDSVLEWREMGMMGCCDEAESCDVCPRRIKWPEQDYDEMADAILAALATASAPSEPSQENRILWNAGREVVDEIVAHRCTVHLEEMDDGQWHLAIYPQGTPGGKRVAMTVRGSILVEEEIEWDQDEEHENEPPAAPSERRLDDLLEAVREWDRVWKPPVAAAGQAMADWKLHESLAAYDRALSTTPEEPE